MVAERSLSKMKKSEIKRLIREQFLCRIAFRGDKYPYIAPFQYAFVKGTLYFHFTAFGRKMKFFEKDKEVCVEIERYKADLSEYMFVTVKGKLGLVTDPVERAKAIRKMRKLGKERLSENFLAAHGFFAKERWDSFVAERPLLIVKLEQPIKESGLKYP